MKIEPFGSNVLLSQDENVSPSEGGILLPGNMAERDSQGKVVAVGATVIACKPGDFVVFRVGKCQSVAGKLLVREEDVLARVAL